MLYSRYAFSVICTAMVLGASSCDTHHGEGRTSFKALTLAYQEAHAQKDVGALLELVYVGTGASAEVNLRRFRAYFGRDLQNDIKGIRRRRLTRDQREVWRHATLKPRGTMSIEWVPRDEQTLETATSYAYGKHNGIYYLLGTGPGAIEEELREWSQGDHPSIKLPGVKQRADLALSRWRNETLDSQPILFWAAYSRPDIEPASLGLDFYDEGMDVVGFGIEERHINPSGTDEVYREKYPVYVHSLPWGNVIHTVSVPVRNRDANQRADAKEWDRYVHGDGISVNIPMSSEDWEATLPPVWVSRPEPNVVEVKVYLYDRAGQESEPVQLLNSLQSRD